MRIVVAAVLVAIAAPAHAQIQGATGIPMNQEKEVSPEVREKRKATEDAYRATMKSIPDAKPVDPWGNMRSSSDPNTAKAKSAAKKSSPR